MRFSGELSVYKIAAALMLLMSATLSAYAARVAPGWIHEHWTTADGLPVNVVSDIAQSDDGYIWLATFDGLVRFGGVRFAVFNSATNPELPSNRFTTVITAADGALWLISEQRHLLRFSDGRFAYRFYVTRQPTACSFGSKFARFFPVVANRTGKRSRFCRHGAGPGRAKPDRARGARDLKPVFLRFNEASR